jgi:flavin-dependent dehydrogenase
MIIAASVVGAGPAGSTLALQLARSGREVALFERETQPAHKVCGEFLSHEAVTYLSELGLHLRALGAVQLHELAVYTAKKAAALELPFSALSLSRRTLDEALLCEAKAAGAHVYRGAGVHEITTTVVEGAGPAFQLNLEDMRIPTHAVFLATGKHDLRSQRREPGDQNDLVAFKMHYALSESQRRALKGRVELVLFEGGYAGIQPVEHRLANLCLVITRKRLREVGQNWTLLLDRLCHDSPHLSARLTAAIPQWDKPLALGRIPYGFVRRHSPDELWRLGDQAAVIPSFAGDGIAIALHSAQLASKFYLEGRSAEAYQRCLHDQVKRQMQVASALSRLMVRGFMQNPLVGLVGLAPRLASALALRTRVPSWALGSFAQGR